MVLVVLKCPYCGADVEIDNQRDSFFCSYCGSKIVNDNVKRVKFDNSEQFIGALTGALNTFIANDYEISENLIDKALEHNGDCSDALYVKSLIMTRKSYGKASKYYELAKESRETVGVVTQKKYDNLLAGISDTLLKNGIKYTRATVSRSDADTKDLDNCKKYMVSNEYSKIKHEFPHLYDIIEKNAEEKFSVIEKSIDIPNRVSEKHWAALRYFDKNYLFESTAIYYSNTSLKSRYAELIESYNERLENKWGSIFSKGPDYVDKKELRAMRDRVKIFVKWIS